MSNRIERKDIGEPTTPLGELANQMFGLIGDDPVRAIIMLVNTETDEAMTATHNYAPESRDAVIDLMMHIQALAAGSGMRLDFMTMDDEGVTKVEGFDAHREEE